MPLFLQHDGVKSVRIKKPRVFGEPHLVVGVEALVVLGMTVRVARQLPLRIGRLTLRNAENIWFIGFIG